MIQAIDAADVLREKLKNGNVSFVYMKADGSKRVANGTTNMDSIPTDYLPKTPQEERKEREGIVTYFDTDKQAWRCCKAINILEIAGEEVNHV